MGISFLFWHVFFKFLEVGGLHNYCIFIFFKVHYFVASVFFPLPLKESVMRLGCLILIARDKIMTQINKKKMSLQVRKIVQ